MAYSRTRDAGGATAVGPYVLLSDPAVPGDHSGVDVGADSGTGPGNHDWLVVWSNLRTINNCDILGRLVLANGQPRSPTVLPIETVGTTFNANPQVSRGNGNGIVDHPRWLVVYGRYFGATVAQIHCHTVDPDGVVGAETPIEDGQGRNLYPQVSSPLRDGARSVFLVTYRRETPATARAATMRFTNTWQGTGWLDLAQLLGVQPDWLRVDSDGERFVLASKEFFAQDCGLRTLGWNGGLIEQNFGYIQSSAEVEVAACRASGGERGDYAATLLQNTTSGAVPRLVRYAGRQAGAMTTVRPTGCNGLTLTGSSSSVLGATMQFTVANAGAAFPGLLFGSAAATPIPICPACALGLRLDMPIDALVGASLAITIPSNPLLVGQDFAVQGFAFGGGTCLGAFSLSDTVQFTVR
jgi:hypothetical protein